MTGALYLAGPTLSEHYAHSGTYTLSNTKTLPKWDRKPEGFSGWKTRFFLSACRHDV